MTPAITTREATAHDDAFLFALFKAVRSADFAHLPMPPAQLEMLMKMQFAGQRQTYAMQYPGGDSIILLDGEPAGRIWLFHGVADHRLVDIALLPEFQNRGIGAALVTRAIADARAVGVTLRCSVAAANQGSLRFHQRLGFQITGRDELYYDLSVGP